ncbi:hypothetical protein BBJ28_00026218 [Nothophytophthora sp. Chile5]|nr:hypothetical protein BBJ28_00026218 [Nothophytophthora sp. Chile5]
MNPVLWLKNDENLGDSFVPKEGDIHVLVVVPEGEVAAPRDSSELQELMEKAVTKALETRDNKRSVYSLSDLQSEHKERMVKKMRLADDVYILIREPPNTLIPGYTWLNVPEDADDQRAGYMAYLEMHFRQVLEEEELCWLNIAKNKTVLSVSDPRLPFRMSGTADVLLVDHRSTQHRVPLAGVRMVVELKKKVEERHKPQAFGELVAASLKAPGNCTPIGLLTDLNNQWYVSWFNAEKVLTHVSLTHPKNAFDFIAAFIAEPGSATSFSVPFINRPLSKFKIGDFLPQPDDGADEMMENYELMADVVEPEFLMARRVEYAQHLVQSMPIRLERLLATELDDGNVIIIDDDENEDESGEAGHEIRSSEEEEEDTAASAPEEEDGEKDGDVDMTDVEGEGDDSGDDGDENMGFAERWCWDSRVEKSSWEHRVR